MNMFILLLFLCLSALCKPCYAGNTESLVILGGGISGLTAAIYASRANLDPLVIEGPEPGGQLLTTSIIDNYPGFPEGITGQELMDRIHQQAERFGTRFLNDYVTAVDLRTRPFQLTLSDGDTVKCEALIIALGASAKWLKLESEQALKGYGVSACAICDGFFYQGKDVVVVGGGDAALEEALILSKYVNKVTVIHRRNELRASPYMQNRAFADEKIHFLWSSNVEAINDVTQRQVTDVIVRNIETQELSAYPCDGVFVAIGHQPRTALFRGQLEMDAGGYLVTSPYCTETSVPGVFAAGDVADPTYRQGITAAGTGSMSALDAVHFLSHNSKRD